MQRRTTTTSESSVSQIHFAVAPYEIEYIVPNDQIYSIYFQKGLQILGSTQYPVQNHQKLKKLELPIQKNLIQFRLSSDKNIEYQWSIYKRQAQMEEFLQTKKISLKDILKKQPERKLELQKKMTLEDKQGALEKIDVQQKKKGKQIKQIKSQTKLDTKLETRSQISFSKPGVYNESLTFETGHFIIKYYLFKAHSFQDLQKIVQDKSKQKLQQRVPLTQISNNKLPTKVNQVQAPNQAIHQTANQKQNQQKPPASQVQQSDEVKQLIIQSQLSEKKIIAKVSQKKKESVKQQVKIQQAKQQIKYPQISQPQPFKQTNELMHQEFAEQAKQEPFSPFKKFQQVSINEQILIKQDTQEHQAIYYPIQTQNPPQKGQQAVETADKTPTPQQLAPPESQSSNSDKKKIMVVLLIIVVLYLVSLMNVFGSDSPVQQKTKKEKKSKFANRKKVINNVQ